MTPKNPVWFQNAVPDYEIRHPLAQLFCVSTPTRKHVVERCAFIVGKCENVCVSCNVSCGAVLSVAGLLVRRALRCHAARQRKSKVRGQLLPLFGKMQSSQRIGRLVNGGKVTVLLTQLMVSSGELALFSDFGSSHPHWGALQFGGAAHFA